MAKRSKAQEVALQVLYEDDLNPGQEPMERTEFLRSRLQEDADLVGFAQSLIDGVRRNRSELDCAVSEDSRELELGADGSDGQKRAAAGGLRNIVH